jgi:hypothetical protein
LQRIKASYKIKSTKKSLREQLHPSLLDLPTTRGKVRKGAKTMSDSFTKLNHFLTQKKIRLKEFQDYLYLSSHRSFPQICQFLEKKKVDLKAYQQYLNKIYPPPLSPHKAYSQAYSQAYFKDYFKDYPRLSTSRSHWNPSSPTE